ncbi:MAG: hypothetical protein HXY35_02170 [Chloroflexi bacterium]|nr:hypothetical protein [Chloroflexota bacterium]
MGASEIDEMKKSLVFAIGLLNFVSTCAGFMIYLNWYDTGDVDFSGWQRIIIAGAVCGIWVVHLCAKPFRTFDGEMENMFLFFIRQVTFNGLGLMGSFATGYVLELLVLAKDPAGAFLIITALLIIPFMTIFYSLMMVPFALYLGITNGLLFRLAIAHKQLQGGRLR